jgi:O-antigen/teichoic acid export membrane protein
MAAWFVAATLAWCVFNLQDSALTGLGAAVVVPVANGVYGVAKIVLLVALVPVSPHWGVYASWTAGLLVVLPAANAVAFRIAARRRARAGTAARPPTRSEIVSFVAPDYAGALLWLAAMTLMPVIVVGIAGPAEAAYFSVAWMLTGPLLAISTSTGAAFVVAAAGDPAQLGGYARAVLRQTACMVVPAAAAIAAGAPCLLRLFGPGYADRASGTLALLALSGIPNILTTLYVRIYRVQQRMRAVVALLAVQCGLVLTLGPILLSAMGIAGIGLVWLVSQTVVALALLAGDRGAVSPGSGSRA